MKIVGVICEYNPFHLGHHRQLRYMRTLAGEGGVVVCLMSGNFVQRGEPALLDKGVRAKAAVDCGANLVLELPMTAALSSAEGFAAAGVDILTKLGCDALCFGCETGKPEILRETARLLLSGNFDSLLRLYLKEGISYPAARQRALEALGGRGEAVVRPNDILAVEYCKAILRSGSPMEPNPIHRPGDYHGGAFDPENPSAASLRRMAGQGENWLAYVPEAARETLQRGTMHTLQAGERAILARLRTMQDGEFEALPYGSEGLWRKFMKNCRGCASVEEILEATKSKRYPRTRLNRMLLCAFLGVTAENLRSPAPYVRALAFDERGSRLLRQAKKSGGLTVVNAGERLQNAYFEMERRAEDLYGLFAADAPEPPGGEERRRVYVSRR